jgi:hypothetical protein
MNPAPAGFSEFGEWLLRVVICLPEPAPGTTGFSTKATFPEYPWRYQLQQLRTFRYFYHTLPVGHELPFAETKNGDPQRKAAAIDVDSVLL